MVHYRPFQQRRQSRSRDALLLGLWTAFIVRIVVPWGDIQNHSHWQKVGWWPFLSPPVKLFDIVANVLLYVPFGAWGVQTFKGRRGALLTMAAAFTLSTACEYTQVYSHWRFPSATDLASNLIGAGVGVYFSRR